MESEISGALRVERISYRVWNVNSESKVGVKYVVFFDKGIFHCTCQGGYINENCKHRRAVKEDIVKTRRDM